jgi:hypothetical protein
VSLSDSGTRSRKSHDDVAAQDLLKHRHAFDGDGGRGSQAAHTMSSLLRAIVKVLVAHT